jgi:RNA polymerase sigma factor (sigma-70 family)
MRLARRSAPTALVKTVEAEDYVLPAITAQEKSFEAIYELLFAPLTDFAARYLGRDGAKDAVQVAMWEIWGRWELVALERPSASFFFRAVRNQVVDARRRKRREMARLGRFLAEMTWLSRSRMPDIQLERAELAALIDATLAAMPERCREVWVLVHENDLTYAQTAESLALSPVTVRRHMMRAQSLVREALTDAGYQEAALQLPRTPHALPPASAVEEGL